MIDKKEKSAVLKELLKTALISVLFIVISKVFLNCMEPMIIIPLFTLCCLIITHVCESLVSIVLCVSLTTLLFHFDFIQTKLEKAQLFQETDWRISALILLMNVGIVILAYLQKSKMKKEHAHSAMMMKINEFLQELLQCNTTDETIDVIMEHYIKLFQHSIIYFIVDPISNKLTGDTKLRLIPGEQEEVLHNQYEMYHINWCLNKNSYAGRFSEYHIDGQITYVPLSVGNKVYGIIGTYIPEMIDFLDRNEIFEFYERLSSMVIENQIVTETQQKLTLTTEKEKLRSNLFRSVSHDFRTPLTSIIGSSSLLMDLKERLNSQESIKLVQGIQEDANWLLRIIENILTITKMNTFVTPLHKMDELVEEVVSEAVNKVRKRYPSCYINTVVPKEPLLVPMDAILIEQVLINLLENAIIHGSCVSWVNVLIRREGSIATFSIIDNGKGIDEERIRKLMEGEVAVDDISSDISKGMGIGLSICSTIVKAHGGMITAKNNTTSGAMFQFTLPVSGGVGE